MSIEFATDAATVPDNIDLTLSLSPPTPNIIKQDCDQKKLEDTMLVRRCGSGRNYIRSLLLTNKKRKRARKSLASDNDGWKIKKVLTQSDVNGNERLMLRHQDVEDHILSLITDEAKVELCRSRFGCKFEVLDDNDGSVHELRLKKHTDTSGSFVFINYWKKNFVKRKGLQKGDTIGITCVSNDRIVLRLLSKGNLEVHN